MLLTKNTIFILASSSEARKKISQKYKLNVEVKNHKINEEKEKERLISKNIEEISLYLAKKKAESIVNEFPNRFIIGSDQVLIFEKKIFGKPKSIDEAKQNFQKFQGKKHQLMSSIYITQNYKKVWTITKKAELYLNKMTNKQVNTYIMKNQKTVLKTVGSYKIENENDSLIQIIEGDIDTIMGFPIKNFLNTL